MMSTLSQTDTAESGEGSRIIHDELRDHAWTSTTTVLEGDRAYKSLDVILSQTKPLAPLTLPHKSH